MGKNILKLLRKDRRASLLVEALLAVMILSVSITLIIRSMTSALSSAKTGAKYTVSLFLLDDRMFEFMRALFIPPGYSDQGSFKSPFEDYEYFVETRRTDNPDEMITALDLTVSFGPAEKPRAIKSQTYFLTEMPDEK